MITTGRRKGAGRFLSKFARDRRGGFAIMLALGAIPLITMIFVGIDVSRMISVRSQLQSATDAAALALARQPSTTQQDPATLKAQAQAWILANLNATVTGVAVDAAISDVNQLQLSASADVGGTMSSLLGLKTWRVSTGSAVNRKLKTVELALVLDNTGSMMEDDGSGVSTKSATLKSASTTLIEALAASAKASGDPNTFKVAMVPFATYVNIKNLAPKLDVKDQSTWPVWMAGTSPYTPDLFDSSATSDKRNRFNMLKTLGMTWGGCVESRPMPYDVQDVAPTATNGNTMFVPYFAPDEPDYNFSYNGTTYDIYTNNYLDDALTTYPDGLDPDPANTPQGYPADPVNGWFKRQSSITKYGDPKYLLANKNPNMWGLDTSGNGPNSGCPAVYVQPLTTNYASVESAINGLTPSGNTHIPLGLVWGWHVLSPLMQFNSGVAGYGDPAVTNNYKIVVLVTDGNNTYWSTDANPSEPVGDGYNVWSSSNVKSTCIPVNGQKCSGNHSVYTSYGYVWQNRIAQDGTSTTDIGNGPTNDPALAMNDRLARLCKNMQNAGIILYTIPLRVTDATTKAKLQKCASPDNVGPLGVKYVDAKSGADLKTAFSNIAGQISALRVSK